MGSKAMSFRFDEDMIELVKEKAKAQKRSLNNYIEMLMHKDVGDIPNEETKKAIAEVMEGKNLEEIKDVDSFMDAL
ncbi:MAG: hypothetical protein CR994_05775 [Maribacter sp.]|nr:MAG: hypothetical protein CR994_05775 [Maribacter sp.]